MKNLKVLANQSTPEAFSGKFPEYKSFVDFENGKRYFFSASAKEIKKMQERKTRLIEKLLAAPAYINGKKKTLGLVLSQEDCDFVAFCDEHRISRSATYNAI